MADLNLHTDKGHLSNFADDTQLTAMEESEEKARQVAQEEAQSVISFFEGVKLCNNPDKAALIWNSKGKHQEIELEVGGEILKSKESEKLLGLNISSSLNWDIHVNKLCHTLKQRLTLLTRIKHKVNSNKLKIIAEAIFMSKIRYGISVYSNPKFEFNHLEQTMDPNLVKIQVVQNDLLRLIEGYRRSDHTNMKSLREKVKMMSVNQLSVYHTATEMFNIIHHSSSDSLHEKLKIEHRGYQLRSLDDGKVKIPNKGKKSCTGFSYNGPKLWNQMPEHIRKTTIRAIFKDKVKEWIWENIPSV